MTKLSDAAIGKTYRSSRGWELLEEIVDLDRMGGYAGEKETAERILDALLDVGAQEPQTNAFDVHAWWRESASLEAGDRVFDGSHEIIALPNTPSGKVTVSLFDAEHGMPEAFEDGDITDRAVLATRGAPEGKQWVLRWEKYGRAVKGGAAGFLLAGDSKGALPPTGHIGLPDETPAEIPSVGISYEVAEWLRRKEPEEVTLSVTSKTQPAESQNVEAVLGPETEKEVLVTAHLDGHDIGDGAEDNGLGCAALVEIAGLLASLEDELETRVRFVGFGSEEIGIIGSEMWAKRNDLDNVKAIVNIDTAGTGRTLKLKTMGFEGFETATSTAADDLEVPVEFMREIIPDSDHWPFVYHGVPASTANSVRKERGRGWGHTHGDTLDKLDQRDLREMSIVLGSTVLELAREQFEIPHVDPAEIRDEVPEHYKRGLQASDQWPF